MINPNEAFPLHGEKIRLQIMSSAIQLILRDGTISLTTDEARQMAAAIFEFSIKADGINPAEQDWTRIPMQFLLFEAIQSEQGESGSPGFAQIRCWVKDQTYANAGHVAAGWIQRDGWRISLLLEQAAVSREDYSGSDDLKYYEQAVIDGEVFVFDIVDPDASESNGRQHE